MEAPDPRGTILSPKMPRPAAERGRSDRHRNELLANRATNHHDLDRSPVLAAQKKRLGEDQVISKPVGTGHQELGDGGCAASAHRLGNDVLAVAALKNPIVKTDIRF
jgi:hypothetical protein